MRACIGIIDHEDASVMAQVQALVGDLSPVESLYQHQLRRSVDLEEIAGLPAILCQREDDERAVVGLLEEAGVRWRWVNESIPEGAV